MLVLKPATKKVIHGRIRETMGALRGKENRKKGEGENKREGWGSINER